MQLLWPRSDPSKRRNVKDWHRPGLRVRSLMSFSQMEPAIAAMRRSAQLQYSKHKAPRGATTRPTAPRRKASAARSSNE
eukprot:14274347-Alexandrium_andersonii.AAC.1